jgi:hypothetical protein
MSGDRESQADTSGGAPQDRLRAFRERGRLRRRLRFLRRSRELALRDLGGLSFELARLGRNNDELLADKIAQLGRITDELRGLETALRDHHAVEELRLAGIGGACPRCGAIHGSADRFCAACGLELGRPGDGEIRAGDQRAR